MLRMNKRHLWLLCALLLVFAGAVTAQDARTLVPGTPMTGTLNANNLVQVYNLQGGAGQVVTLTVTNQGGVPLALVLTDASGNIISQGYDLDITGQVTLNNVTLPSTGEFLVTVFKSAGVDSFTDVTFTLLLIVTNPPSTPLPTIVATPVPTTETGTTSPLATQETGTTAPPTQTPSVAAAATPFVTGQLLTTSGMTVQLSWNTTDDLDIEVRDPVGGSLYWETPTTASGGTLSANQNQGCANPTTTPIETASWSPGGIPTGSYEVLVYFQKACAGTAPVTFTVQTTVDGTALAPVTDTVLEGQVYVSSFVVNADGTSQVNTLRGIVTDQLPGDPTAVMAAAQPINVGIAVNGTITNAQPYQAYSFTGQANDQVTIDMNATGGSLDTFLFLLDPAGAVVSINDDSTTGVTNSEIANALLPQAGMYTIVATRYAKRIGGTEGTYTLMLTTQATQLSQAFLELPRGALEFRLLWNNATNQQLLVRDPAGNSVYVDVPQISSGGQMVASGNVNCTPPDGTPFSYIYWTSNTPPRAGVYEVQVWFQSECNDTTPVHATLYITYNGKEVITDTINPQLDDRFLTSFTITTDGQVIPSDGGIIDGADSLNWQADLENAVIVQPGEPQTGSITQDNKFDLYVFQGQAGDVYNIAMNNTSGTLDPSLYLVGPLGDQIAANDDAVAGENTNSLIANLTLPADGQYIIIATHFGGQYGGTTGTYSLTLTKLN